MITGEIKNKIDKIWTTFWTGGSRYYSDNQLKEYLGLLNKDNKKIFIYSRVSNKGQIDDLKNQINFLKNNLNFQDIKRNQIQMLKCIYLKTVIQIGQ